MLINFAIALVFLAVATAAYLSFSRAYNLFSDASNRATKAVQRVRLFIHVMHRAVVRYRKLSNKSFITTY